MFTDKCHIFQLPKCYYSSTSTIPIKSYHKRRKLQERVEHIEEQYWFHSQISEPMSQDELPICCIGNSLRHVHRDSICYLVYQLLFLVCSLLELRCYWRCHCMEDDEVMHWFHNMLIQMQILYFYFRSTVSLKCLSRYHTQNQKYFTK